MNKQAHMITPWATLPRPVSGNSPLDPIVGMRASADAFTNAQLDRLRRHVAVALPVQACPELDEFVGEFFSQPEAVVAYFRPTHVHVGRDARQALRTVLPFDQALKAARRSAAMPALLPHERGLAWLAAFIYPCGLFQAADPSFRKQSPVGSRAPEHVKALRYALVQDALRQLRRRCLPLGDALAAALDLGAEDQCDAEQVARLIASVRLAVVDIERLWRGCDGSSSH